MFKIFQTFKDPLVRREYYKYLAVGTLAFIVDFFLLGLVMYISRPSYFGGNFFNVFTADLRNSRADSLAPSVVVIATGVGFFVSYVLNYILSVFFVYRYGAVGKSVKGFLKFMLFGLLGLFISSAGQWIGYELLDINVWIVKLILFVIVFVFNYITRKLFIFNIELIIDEEKQIRL